MTARPTHAMQQQAVDEALEVLPGKRWGWLFQPDAKWLASINTTTLREVNAVRMFVLVTVLWNGLGSAVTAFALGRCYVMLAPLVKSETGATVRLLCEESLATHRMLDFASGLFSSYGILLGAMAGIAVGAMWAKRATDTEHRVEVEKAKKPPVLMAPTTAEHQAQAPVNQTVNLGDDAIAAASSQPRPQEGSNGQTEDQDHQWRQGKPDEGLG